MNAKKGYALVLIAALMWGCIGIFVNNLTALGLSSVSIAALRLLFGAAMLAPVLAAMGARGSGVPAGERPSALALFRVPPSSLVPCALVGIVGLAFANLGYYISMGEVGMSTASVLLYTSPVFGVALGRLLYREPATSNKFASIAINIIGCVLAVTNGDFSSMGFSTLGIIAGVAAGFMGALLAVFSKVATERAHPLAVTFYGFVFGGATMLALASPWTDIVVAASPRLLLFLLGFGLIPTALAYIFYMNGLSMAGEDGGHLPGAHFHLRDEHELREDPPQRVLRSCRGVHAVQWTGVGTGQGGGLRRVRERRRLADLDRAAVGRAFGRESRRVGIRPLGRAGIALQLLRGSTSDPD